MHIVNNIQFHGTLMVSDLTVNQTEKPSGIICRFESCLWSQNYGGVAESGLLHWS